MSQEQTVRLINVSVASHAAKPRPVTDFAGGLVQLCIPAGMHIHIVGGVAGWFNPCVPGVTKLTAKRRIDGGVTG